MSKGFLFPPPLRIQRDYDEVERDGDGEEIDGDGEERDGDGEERDGDEEERDGDDVQIYAAACDAVCRVDDHGRDVVVPVAGWPPPKRRRRAFAERRSIRSPAAVSDGTSSRRTSRRTSLVARR